MEDSTDIFDSVYGKYAVQFVYFGCFSTIVMFIISTLRTKATDIPIPSLPVTHFIFYGLQTYFGVCKTPIGEVFMKIGTLVGLKYNSYHSYAVSNDYELIKQMLTSPDEWLDRPKNPLLIIRANGNQDRGLLTSSGEVWKDTRRHTVKTLTQLGLGKKSNLVYTTNKELELFLGHLENAILNSNNRVPVRNLFSLPTINVVWRIIGGTSFSADDKEFIEIVNATDAFVEVNFYQLVLSDILRFVLLYATRLFCYSKIYNAQNTLKKHFAQVLDRRQKAIDDNEYIDHEENFTDLFLQQMKINRESGDNKTEHIFNRDNLMVALFDLFEAGVDTTSSTLEFAMMYLVNNPRVQQKIRKEIKIVIGDKDPSFYMDRNSMPYTQAVIYEVHRMASIVPLNFRGSIRDCVINGHHIKKGSCAIINLYSIHYDVKYWGDPYEFRPERFLGPDGDLEYPKLRRILNFGAGKRVCLGESVASISLFTFLVGILRKYEVEQADRNELLGPEVTSSFTSRAKNFQVRFIQLENQGVDKYYYPHDI